MEIQISIEKKHIYLLSLIFLIMGSLIVIGATPFNSNIGWHPLQQTATDETGTASVDANSNAVIDKAENLEVINGISTVGNETGEVVLAVKGGSGFYSSIDFYSGSTNEWGIGKDTAGDFYIDKSGVGNTLTIDGNRNVLLAGSIKISYDSSECTSANEGAQRYNSVGKVMEYCNSTDWKAFGIAVAFLCGTDTVTDGDGKSYDTVLIGTQCWMATNLEYPSSGGCRDVAWVNNNDVGWCGYYNGIDYGDEGLLYEWSAAMNGAAACNGVGESQPSCSTPVQGLCPAGWHIPSHYEFTALEREVCDTGAQCLTDFPYDESTAYYVQGTDEGDQLKRAIDCYGCEGSGGSSNFNALLTGMTSYGTGNSDNRGTYTRLWSSSVRSSDGYKWNRYLSSNFAGIYPAANPGHYGWSVRCIKD